MKDSKVVNLSKLMDYQNNITSLRLHHFHFDITNTWLIIHLYKASIIIIQLSIFHFSIIINFKNFFNSDNNSYLTFFNTDN